MAFLRLVLLLVLACSAGTATAQDRYHRCIQHAAGIFWRGAPTAPKRIDAAYRHLAKCAGSAPDRWEAYFERGLNRCQAAIWGQAAVRETVGRARALGSSMSEIRQIEQQHRQFNETCLLEAHRGFTIAMERMRKAGQFDQNYWTFAEASLKFAAREYTKAQGGRPGAIDDFKKLIGRRFLVELAQEQIAWCYLDLGYEAFQRDEFEEAHAHWDEALNWAKREELRRIIFTNKAGAYEMDQEFGRAEKLLRRQIDAEPDRAVHWKNMGLVLGYQARLKEALYSYRRAREACGPVQDERSLARWHGNAWLRAATIHSKLLEQDGDVAVAWRLFVEYRDLHGDDYNFCLAFGDVCAAFKQYDLAWTYLQRAKALQPQCPATYLKIEQIAARTSGTRDEVRARIKEAKFQRSEISKRFQGTDEASHTKRICGGLRDMADGSPASDGSRLTPDPLAGFSKDTMPPWLAAVATTRAPFNAFVPDVEVAPVAGPRADNASKASVPAWVWWTAGGAILVLAVVALMVSRGSSSELTS